MRVAIDRFSSQTLGRIPDLTQIARRRQVVLGVIAAILFHLIALPLLVAFFAFWEFLMSLVVPVHREPAPTARQQLEVTVMPPKPEQSVVPAFEEHRPIFDPRGLEASKEKPKDARFESDQDMVAGSQLPATGLLPLPSQEGRTDRPSADFADQDVHLKLAPEQAKSDTAAHQAEAASPNTVAQPAEAQPAAAQAPLYTPQPISKEALAAAEKAPPEQKLPDPAKQARATPPPLEKVEKVRPDQIAVSRPSEKTTPGPITKVEPATPTPRLMAMLPTPKPFGGPSAYQRYQESLAKTKIEGTISNRGTPGVDAVATSAGRWWMRTKNAIGQNWYLFTDQRRDMVTTGSVRISFSIDAEGHLHDVRIESATGNSSLAEVCLRAIKETPIPPPPPDVVEPFQNHRIDNSITFNYF